MVKALQDQMTEERKTLHEQIEQFKKEIETLKQQAVEK
jgi:cell division septum initiation protein DivIVA